MLDNPWPFLLFVLVMTSTPGPGNLAHMAIGQTFGFRAALPFLAGTLLGGFALDVLVAVGLGQVIVASPMLNTGLKALGMAYIVYLAVRVVRSQAAQTGQAKRFRFSEGLLIHPLSPKSWAMAVAALPQFVDPAQPMLPQQVFFVASFVTGGLIFHSLWCVAGASLMGLLSAGRVRVAVNAVMAGLMVLASAGAMI